MDFNFVTIVTKVGLTPQGIRSSNSNGNYRVSNLLMSNRENNWSRQFFLLIGWLDKPNDLDK